ncbi:ASCH domain-containing protein [Streptomyces sp. NPDC028635]|uniref:ASCH domain-containing protein n=1 Tax=Streptomyces sp. NPDC028635 TaxID=3154800 RepID=UPI0033FF4584
MTHHLRHLTQEDLELVEFARRIVEENGDGEVHTVGAAVRDARGRVFGGINLYHFTGGPCAELVALGHARAAGARELAAIVAVGDNGRGVLAPCGRDRQVLLDHHPGIRVLVPTDDGVRGVAVADLLPHSYVWADHLAAASDSGSGSHSGSEDAGSEDAGSEDAGSEDAGLPAVVAPSLPFHRDYLDAVRAGRKTTTVRRGASVTTGPVDLVFELDEDVVLPGVVTALRHKKARELTEEDAVADGFRDLATLHDRLRYHYPGIGPDDEVTVVHFRLADA